MTVDLDLIFGKGFEYLEHKGAVGVLVTVGVAVGVGVTVGVGVGTFSFVANFSMIR